MNVLELKGGLLEMIANVRDEGILRQLQSAFKKIIQPENDWWDDLTAEQQAELEATLAECDDPNNMVSDKDAQKQIDEALLSEEQIIRLKKNIAYSRASSNLIDHEDVKKKYDKWFTCEQNEQLKIAIAESRMPENQISYKDIKQEFAQYFKNK